MADAGLVQAGERGRRDRKPYAITDAGRAASPDGSTGIPVARLSASRCCSPWSSAGTCPPSDLALSSLSTSRSTPSAWPATKTNGPPSKLLAVSLTPIR